MVAQLGKQLRHASQPRQVTNVALFRGIGKPRQDAEERGGNGAGCLDAIAVKVGEQNTFLAQAVKFRAGGNIPSNDANVRGAEGFHEQQQDVGARPARQCDLEL